VSVIQPMPQQYRVNTNDRFDLDPSEVFVVTRVNAANLNIRGPKMVRDGRWPHNTVQKDVSFSVDRMFLRFEDPNYIPPPPPRKLGVKPDDDDLIGIDHPGIQWLFDDMGVYAEREGYCSQYDALCVKLGIPGRPRDFTINRTINGIEIRATIKARSQREANEKFTEAMSTPTPDPDFAPAA
jgi:hypothetical protein